MDLSRFLEAARQGCVDAWSASRYWKDSPSPPAAPDYTGAAQATAAGNLEAAKYATAANRVNQYTPYGSLTYQQIQDPNYSPGDPRSNNTWRSDVNLSPTGEQLLGYANNAALGLGQQTGQALDRVNQGLSQPFDQSSVGDVADQSYAAQTARLDPQWQQRQGMEENKLANQGLVPGGKAYDNAMRVFGEGRNDAYSQARQNAIATMPQTYQLAQALRSQPLNELNALRTGSQVQNPTFTPVPQQQTTAGPNYLGAAQAQYGGQLDQYNAGVGGNNALMGGLFSLAGSAAGAPWMGPLVSGLMRG